MIFTCSRDKAEYHDPSEKTSDRRHVYRSSIDRMARAAQARDRSASFDIVPRIFASVASHAVVYTTMYQLRLRNYPESSRIKNSRDESSNVSPGKSDCLRVAVSHDSRQVSFKFVKLLAPKSLECKQSDFKRIFNPWLSVC